MDDNPRSTATIVLLCALVFGALAIFFFVFDGEVLPPTAQVVELSAEFRAAMKSVKLPPGVKMTVGADAILLSYDVYGRGVEVKVDPKNPQEAKRLVEEAAEKLVGDEYAAGSDASGGISDSSESSSGASDAARTLSCGLCNFLAFDECTGKGDQAACGKIQTGAGHECTSVEGKCVSAFQKACVANLEGKPYDQTLTLGIGQTITEKQLERCASVDYYLATFVSADACEPFVEKHQRCKALGLDCARALTELQDCRASRASAAMQDQIKRVKKALPAGVTVTPKLTPTAQVDPAAREPASAQGHPDGGTEVKGKYDACHEEGASCGDGAVTAVAPVLCVGKKDQLVAETCCANGRWAAGGPDACDRLECPGTGAACGTPGTLAPGQTLRCGGEGKDATAMTCCLDPAKRGHVLTEGESCTAYAPCPTAAATCARSGDTRSCAADGSAVPRRQTCCPVIHQWRDECPAREQLTALIDGGDCAVGEAACLTSARQGCAAAGGLLALQNVSVGGKTATRWRCSFK